MHLLAPVFAAGPRKAAPWADASGRSLSVELLVIIAGLNALFAGAVAGGFLSGWK